ncbi:hypothetical protein Cgig2_005750 [Carnegiea gigantea]|uniref:Reverse transcriptase zinc-binding domain-containing protein n=1 Tax=Carnegiea gigantea TaxID=171969 RepID=A0A9Q1KHY8_9CARY|nr:hypothetical protein Cgig2_016482 [Carnegiea gigantea]KAJ8443199.1 hypothetical protein Cgig2_005750 [Carnegiea gigantea]
MWVTDPSCHELIAKAQTLVDNVLAKVDNCSIKLAAWNKNSFGHVGREISKLEDSLKYLTDPLSKREVLEKEWRHKEEIMWWQRARTDFLKYRDSNIRWFHSQASMRRTKNVISKLQDADGVVYTDLDKLEHIMESRWMPRPFSFQPITLRSANEGVSKVSELIDVDQGCWQEGLVRELFLPCDMGFILSIPLSNSKPRDKLICHYTNNGQLSVRSAYHLKMTQKFHNMGSASRVNSQVWKIIWHLNIPPRIRVFSWRLYHGALPT